MPRFPELLQPQTPAVEVEERSQQLQDVQRTSRIKQETRSQEAKASDQQHLARNLLNQAVEIEAQAASLAVKVKFQNKQRCVEDLSALDWTLHSAEYLEMLREAIKMKMMTKDYRTNTNTTDHTYSVFKSSTRMVCKLVF
jgi:hypothetical protein